MFYFHCNCQVLNRSTDHHNSSKSGHSSNSVTPAPTPLMPCLPPTIPPMTVIPQQLITAGTRKDCIRLRGLPYEAQVEHILEFLGDHAKNIVYQGVHMVFNAQVTVIHYAYFMYLMLTLIRDNRVVKHLFKWILNLVPSELPTRSITDTWCLVRSRDILRCSSAVVRTCQWC